MPIRSLQRKCCWDISYLRLAPICRVCARMAAIIWSRMTGKSVAQRLSGAFRSGVAINYFVALATGIGWRSYTRKQQPTCAGGWNTAAMRKDGWSMPVRGESGQDVSSRFGPQQTGGTIIQHVRPVDLQASM